MKKTPSSGFTLIEMLVVISIIAVLAAFAVPALTSALTRGQLTGTMNNARQLYLAGQQMALDGAANSDPNLTWPGDSNPAMVSLQDYIQALTRNDYIKPGDVQKLFSAPGVTATVTVDNTTTPPTVTFASGAKSALKVFKVKEADSGNSIFAVTANYTYNTTLGSGSNPFGDKGFVVQRKAGDAAILRKSNAVATSGAGQQFQTTVGKLGGDADGTPSGSDTSADGRVPLTNP